MPRPSSLHLLPAKLREEVAAEIRARDYTGYCALSARLRAQGFAISKSALQRFGMLLRAKDGVYRVARAHERELIADLVKVIRKHTGGAGRGGNDARNGG